MSKWLKRYFVEATGIEETHNGSKWVSIAGVVVFVIGFIVGISLLLAAFAGSSGGFSPTDAISISSFVFFGISFIGLIMLLVGVIVYGGLSGSAKTKLNEAKIKRVMHGKNLFGMGQGKDVEFDAEVSYKTYNPHNPRR